MKIASFSLVAVLLSLSINANADLLGGTCRVQAQKAVNAIARINGSKLSGPVLLLETRGPVETYSSESYRILLNTGSDDYTDCSVMSVTFSPQP